MGSLDALSNSTTVLDQEQLFDVSGGAILVGFALLIACGSGGFIAGYTIGERYF
jgi:lactobin A/cerein 7B family class IIb bacteriocin